MTTVTTVQLMTDIVNSYTETMPAEKIIQTINDHFAELPASTSKIDPQRVASQSNFISRLKKALALKVGPVDVDGQDEFNKLEILEQLRFQKQSQTTGKDRWVHAIELLPKNITSLAPPSSDIQTLKKMRMDIDTSKLRDELVKVDVDVLMNKLCPYLSGGKRHQIAAALLLVTGRRTNEILQSARFYLGKGHTANGYFCMFSGQSKEGLFPTPDYEIPLLASFSLVQSAMGKIREMYDTKNLTTPEVNHYAVSIGSVTRALKINPHGLRTVYALTTYSMLKKKPSLIGHISRVLGHMNPQNATYYSRMKIVNFSGVWVGESSEPDAPADGWIANGLIEKKRIEAIKQMVKDGIKLTASSIRINAGGTLVVAQRIIKNNKELIDGYNKSLE